VDKPALESFVGAGGSALVIGLVSVVRKAWPKLPPRFIPLLAIFLGVMLNLVIAIAQHNAILDAIIFGIVAGLAGVGLYATATRLTPGSNTK
jgi:hypothetical protein